MALCLPFVEQDWRQLKSPGSASAPLQGVQVQSAAVPNLEEQSPKLHEPQLWITQSC